MGNVMKKGSHSLLVLEWFLKENEENQFFDFIKKEKKNSYFKYFVDGKSDVNIFQKEIFW